LRNCAATRKPSKQRSKRRNGKLVLNGRSQRGRRLAELIRAYAQGLDLDDEYIAGLVKSTSSIALEAEGLEEKSERGETIDHFAFARLINTRERNLEKLRVMRAKAQAPAQPAGARTGPSPLALHLQAMHAASLARRKAAQGTAGAAPGAKGPRD
jgi:hypothetical protein